ncbi:hypothetical protein [Aequorivita viscosa]|uniref:Uncharacterized protein n=1 Tax=Aequorivita viscosa TaxID=797419 RepID=A0A1M6MUV3_9FLAO|nr:hypothetical protein [Aequorivita viscosa]SDX37238.1 hypothetical protein SAMN05216556_12711 [Aequorivita viscosa]SHJ87180.1 hypothetical protein SAMN04487908_12934 [Aequorivita viscosa]
MRIIKVLIVITLVVTSFSSCTSFDDKVKEYRDINDEIAKIQDKILDGTINQGTGVEQISELKLKLNSFDSEVSEQYASEEKVKQEIEQERKRLIEKKRLDSIEEAKIAYEEELRLKREVAEMIRMEEEAERIAYLEELKERGVFLVEFDDITYEINQKDWNDYKIAEDYDSQKIVNETKDIIRFMGNQKVNNLANSMYRTLTSGISKEGITLKALEGIQIYNVLTTGDPQFN